MKEMGEIRTTNAHECTRMAKELFNHEKHEKHENKKRGEEEPRMHTNIIYSWDCSTDYRNGYVEELVLPWVAFCAFVAFAPPTAYILLLGEE